ncbi:hypothetical protein LZ32DRAFT_609752 [Colletotrichum eremochloae]|nr:hypothetical protein LZ32DRAFT_609752 [Colletotrichum eremochloae]
MNKGQIRKNDQVKKRLPVVRVPIQMDPQCQEQGMTRDRQSIDETAEPANRDLYRDTLLLYLYYGTPLCLSCSTFQIDSEPASPFTTETY